MPEYEKRIDECDHENTRSNIYGNQELEEFCNECGAKRVGHVAWGDWEGE